MISSVPELAGGGINEKLDLAAWAAFYGRMIAAAGIAPDYAAEPGCVAYLSDHARVLLVRHRSMNNPPSRVQVESPRLAGLVFDGAVNTMVFHGPERRGAVDCALGGNAAAIVQAVARLEPSGDGELKTEIVKEPSGPEEGRMTLRVTGNVPARIMDLKGKLLGQYKPGAEMSFSLNRF
jgi:hypothetical protein